MFFDEVVDDCATASSASTDRSRPLIQQVTRERKRSRRSTRGRQSLVPYDDDMDIMQKPTSQSDSISVGETGFKKLLRTQNQLAKVAKEVKDEKRYLKSLREQLRLWEELLGEASSNVECELQAKDVSTSIKQIPSEQRKKLHGQLDYNHLLYTASERFGNGRRSQQGANAVKEEAFEREMTENRKLTEDMEVISQALVIARIQPSIYDIVGQWQQLEARFQDECRMIAELGI